MSRIQLPPYPIDLSLWEADADYGGIFPKGAREKSLYNSPDDVSEYPFLKPSFSYLFKESFYRYPEQFWVEIIAYKIGCLMGVKVPPVFVASRKDSDAVTCGALIEWFYDVNSGDFISYHDGGDLFGLIIEDFDHKLGTKHNLKDIFSIFKGIERLEGTFIDSRWIDDWIKIIIFDSLIGNTDRHQNNWGIIYKINKNKQREVSLSPAFDNGTSSGYEILDRKFVNFKSKDVLQRYIDRGRHHIRFAVGGERLGHFEAIDLLFSKFPHSIHVARCLIGFNFKQLESDLFDLTKFDLPVHLTNERIDFVLMLLRERILRLNYLIDMYAT